MLWSSRNKLTMSTFPAKELTFTWPRIRVPDRPRRSEDPGRVRAVWVCMADSRLGRVRHLSYPSNERSGRSGRPYPRRSCSLRPARQPLCVRRCRSAGRAAALPRSPALPNAPLPGGAGAADLSRGRGRGHEAGRSVRLVVCVLPGPNLTKMGTSPRPHHVPTLRPHGPIS